MSSIPRLPSRRLRCCRGGSELFVAGIAVLLAYRPNPDCALDPVNSATNIPASIPTGRLHCATVSSES
uniref:Uncharacterized protein n=1 Tax=Mycena chlorophos TaxID=658473 RepID=A0ABQ0LG19_MYCCL|nr:predicted protein [Mycena chlorophos]